MPSKVELDFKHKNIDDIVKINLKNESNVSSKVMTGV